MLPFGVIIPATVPQRSEILDGLMNYPVYLTKLHNDNEKAACGTNFINCINSLPFP